MVEEAEKYKGKNYCKEWNFIHTTFLTSSPAKNLQISSMLLTCPSWKLLSTKPSNGSMPQEDSEEYNEKQRELEVITKYVSFLLGFELFCLCSSLALLYLYGAAGGAPAGAGGRGGFPGAVISVEELLAVSLGPRKVPSWRRSTKKNLSFQFLDPLHGIFRPILITTSRVKK
jgi:hypothetical protein